MFQPFEWFTQTLWVSFKREVGFGVDSLVLFCLISELPVGNRMNSKAEKVWITQTQISPKRVSDNRHFDLKPITSLETHVPSDIGSGPAVMFARRFYLKCEYIPNCQQVGKEQLLHPSHRQKQNQKKAHETQFRPSASIASRWHGGFSRHLLSSERAHQPGLFLVHFIFTETSNNQFMRRSSFTGLTPTSVLSIHSLCLQLHPGATSSFSKVEGWSAATEVL